MNVIFLPFNNSAGISGDPKLKIIYNLYNSDGTSYNPGVVSAFYNSTRTIAVETNVTAYPIVNPMKIVAYFAYNPSYTVTVNFTVYFDYCSSTMIVP